MRHSGQCYLNYPNEYQTKMAIKKQATFEDPAALSTAAISFQGNASSKMVDSLKVDYPNVPEIRTEKDKALRVLRIGTVITTIGVSCIGIGVYGIQNTI